MERTPEFLSTPELAERTDFSVSALKKYVGRGLIHPAGRVGRSHVWRSDDVEAVKRELATAGRSGRRPVTERLSGPEVA